MTYIISRPQAFSQHEPRLNGFESSHSSCSPPSSPFFGLSSRSPYSSGSPSTSNSNRFNEIPAGRPTLQSIPEKRHVCIDLEMMRMKNKGEMSKIDYKTTMDGIYNSSTITSKDKHKQMIAVNEKWNASLDANVIDVHSLHQNHIDFVIGKNIKVIRSLHWNCLYVVTGVGNGSPGKVPVLKRRVQEFAAKSGYGCAQMAGNPGILIISIVKN